MTDRPNSPAARDVAYHLHPYTNARQHEAVGPFIVSRGKGIYVYDDQGKEYIEGLASLWSASLGFSNERLARVAAQQLATLPTYHNFAHKTAEPVIELAERLVTMAPVPMSKAIFADSGSEANDMVMKLIWFYNNARGRPEKKKIISRVKAYHGVTALTASLTGLPHLHNDFDLPFAGVLHAGCPHHYRFAQEGESEDDFASRLAEELDQLIQEENPETVAAFIGEPVMGAGGVIVPPQSYWPKIQAVLRKHDVLVIADEVICGFGRTGNMFGSQTFGIEPDIITVAKALTSGYMPISAALLSDPIYQVIADNTDKLGTLGHGYTYTGHPVASAVALETLKIYEETDIVGHVRGVMDRLQSGLHRFADHPLVGEVRGVGLIAGIELVADKASKTPFDPPGRVGAAFANYAQAHGLIIRPLGDSIGVCPPLIIEAAEIDSLLERFALALDETLTWVGDQGLASVA